MKIDSRMSIEYGTEGNVTVIFNDLKIGDVFRIDEEDKLYMVTFTSPPSLSRQAVNLSNGGWRSFRGNSACVRVNMTATWVDQKP